MPIIRVEMFSGRSREQKKAIARELIDCFIRGAGGGKPEAFNVIFTEIEKQDWSAGYEMMADKYPDT